MATKSARRKLYTLPTGYSSVHCFQFDGMYTSNGPREVLEWKNNIIGSELIQFNGEALWKQ